MGNSLNNVREAVYDAYAEEMTENVVLRHRIETAFFELEMAVESFNAGINQHYFSDIDTPPIWVGLQ